MDEQGRRVRSGETWAAARAAYLDGMSAATVCAQFDLGISALRARARREGWRRGDQPDPAPNADPELDEDLDEELEADGPADFTAMAERAARMASRCLVRGDARGSDGWMRVYLKLRPFAKRRHEDLQPAPVQARLDAFHRGQAITTPDNAPDVHSVHSVHPDEACTSLEPSPSRAPNRAERRKQARLGVYQAAAARRTGAALPP